MTTAEAYYCYPQVMNQKEKIEKLGLSEKKPDIATKNAQNIFNEIIKQIYSIHTSIPKITAFQSITNDECIALTQQFYSQLFDGKYDYFIEELIKKTKICKLYPWYNAEICYELNYEGNRQRIDNITIDQDTTLFHSVELSHEYAHGLLSANKIIPGTLVCYQELISILLEKIAAYHLSKIQPDIEYKQVQFRKTGTKDSSDTYRKETTFLQYNAEEIGKKTALVTNYYIDKAYSYIIGDIYSEKLLEFYKQDPKEISSRISRIIDRKETVTKVLRDLDVSLTNQDTIKTYQKSLHKL